jgi:hypothetical protein
LVQEVSIAEKEKEMLVNLTFLQEKHIEALTNMQVIQIQDEMNKKL